MKMGFRFAFVVFFYIFLGWFGLKFATINDNASPIWPVSGFAFGICYLWGRRYLLSVFVGATVINFVFAGSSIFTAAAIGFGNSLEALLAIHCFAWASQKMSDWRMPLTVLSLGFSSFISPFASATIGVLAIYFSGSIPLETIQQSWITWWTGDLLGILTCAPLVLGFRTNPFVHDLSNFIRGLLFSLFTGLVVIFIFSNSHQSIWLSAVILSLILTASFSGSWGVRFSIITISLTAVFLTDAGLGPFLHGDLNSRFVQLQIFLGALSVVGLGIMTFLKMRTFKLSLIPILSGWVLTSVVLYTDDRLNQTQTEYKVDELVKEAINELQDNFESYEDVMRAAAGLITSSVQVDEEEWRRFIQELNLQSRHPNVLAVAYVDKVDVQDRAQFENKMRQTLRESTYQIRFLNQAAMSESESPVHHHQYYAPLRFVEPKARNRSSIGTDLASERVRRSAAERSVMRGRVALAGPLHLQTASRNEGFILFYPVFSPGELKQSFQDRLNQVRGWVVIPLGEKELIADVKSKSTLGFRITTKVSGPNQNFEVYTSETFQSDMKTDRRDSLNLGGQDFEIEWSFSPSFWTSLDGSVSWTPIVAVILTLLLTAFVVGAHRFRKDAEDLATKMTKQLREKSAVLEKTMEISPTGFFISNLSGELVYVNRTWQEIVGINFDEAMKDGWMKAVHPDDIHRVRESWDKALRSASQKLEFRFRNRRTKQIVYVLGSTKELFDEEGRGAGFVGTIQDVTSIKENQERLVESARLASLGEMAASIAHEINNPLAIICGKAAAIKGAMSADTIDREKLTLELNKIESTGFRISKIVKALRTVSRSGENDPFEWTPLNSIVHSVLDLCREKFKNEGIQLEIQSPENLEVNCREVQIAQVLVNLLNNAFDAVQHFSEKWVHVDISRLPGDGVRLTVTDSGSGLSENVLPKIMTPFFTTKEVGSGTGLGLSISKSIMQSHDGDLYVDRSAAHTTFIIEFPSTRVRECGESISNLI